MEGVHQACLLSYIIILYILGEKLRSYLGDLKKKTDIGMAQSSLLDLTTCPPQYLPFTI